uniref:Uncharacterized protein LOC103499856 isoform X1 n=1 Tax=Rhizophora mucronata TaxID=61149 RepID=A0A2P2MVW7_RHIMU
MFGSILSLKRQLLEGDRNLVFYVLHGLWSCLVILLNCAIVSFN